MLTWSRYGSLLLALALLACGSPASQQGTIADSTGAESSAEPPPPPAPAYLRVVHASPEPTATSLQISVDGAEPVITQLAPHDGSTYVELAPGARMLSTSPSGADSTATLAFVESPELGSNRRYTAIVHGLANAEPAMAMAIVPERDQAPTEGLAGVRVFHAIAGIDALDICIAGTGPRDPAAVLHAGLGYGNFGSAEAGPYAEIPAEGELALQLRAPHATPCRGRLLGVARTALSAGINHSLVLFGRTTGRPRVERELVVCTEGADGSCIAMPVTSR